MKRVMKIISNPLFVLLLFLIHSLAFSVSYKNFNSYKQQIKLFKDLNAADYSNTPSEFYNNIENEIPNLTFTSVPIKALKAMYFLENEPDSLNYVKSLLKKSIIDNPFLKFSEGNLSQIYYAQRNYDSAYYFAREAFKGLPKNAVHFAMIAKLYANQSKIDSIIFTFKKINTRPLVDINRVFFASMNNFYLDLNDSLKKYVFNEAINAKNNFRKDKDLQFLVDNIIYSKDSVNLALELEKKGEKLLANQNWVEGIENYLRALEIRENYLPYIQTIGLSYFNLKEHQKSIDYFELFIKNGADLDPISLYVMGINKYNTKKYEEACQYLDRARKFGQKDAEVAYLRYCKS